MDGGSYTSLALIRFRMASMLNRRMVSTLSILRGKRFLATDSTLLSSYLGR
jgi:hypothetical protein